MAMKNKNMSAVVRWVLKDQAEPVIGICVPMYEYPGDGTRLDYMLWVKVRISPTNSTISSDLTSCHLPKTSISFGSLL
jgi:ATP-dependent DNA helicase 2 subunit 2